MDSTYVTEQLFLVNQMNYLRWKTFHDVIRHLKQSEPVSFKQVDFVHFKKKPALLGGILPIPPESYWMEVTWSRLYCHLKPLKHIQQSPTRSAYMWLCTFTTLETLSVWVKIWRNCLSGRSDTALWTQCDYAPKMTKIITFQSVVNVHGQRVGGACQRMLDLF